MDVPPCRWASSIPGVSIEKCLSIASIFVSKRRNENEGWDAGALERESEKVIS